MSVEVPDFAEALGCQTVCGSKSSLSRGNRPNSSRSKRWLWAWPSAEKPIRKPSSGSEDNVFFVGEPVRHLHEINIDKPQIVDGTNAIHGQFVTPKEPMIRKICSPSQVSYPLENSDGGLSTYQFNYPYAPCMVYLPT